MFDTLCTFPLSAELFAQAVHPSEPLVAVGLSSGHVETLQLPPIDEAANPTFNHQQRRGSNGTDVFASVWRTKRHKGSCRCLAYNIDGSQLYSAGTDGLVKAADSATGVVIGKVAIPSKPSASTSGSSSLGSAEPAIDAPTVVHALTPQTLLLGTDSGALHLFDLRDPAPSVPVSSISKTAFSSPRPSQTYHPHTDYISSLTPIPPSSSSTSGFSKQFLTTGSTTLALTDMRRGVLAKSEDQEDLLLSSLYITDLPARKSSGSSGEKAVVGTGEGVVTLWEKGAWDDQDERIIVSREKETLDCMAHVPDGVSGMGKKIVVGLGDGSIRFLRFGMNKVVGEVKHDEVEGVSEIGFDMGGRMISGGGMVLKVWAEHIAEETAEDEDGDSDIEDDDDDDDDSDGGQAKSHSKRALEDGSDENENQTDDSSNAPSEDENNRKRRKKRKRGKEPALNGRTAPNFAGLD